MAQIGSFALLLALALSVYSFLAGLIALFRQDEGSERLSETARRAGVATFAAVLLAAAALVFAAFQDDFRIAYIFHHSNRDLSAPYKFATLWSGQEGSLLFWSLLLSAYGFVLRLRYKTDPRLFAYASVILAAVQIFFLSLVNFAANPFGLLEGPARPDGSASAFGTLGCSMWPNFSDTREKRLDSGAIRTRSSSGTRGVSAVMMVRMTLCSCSTLLCLRLCNSAVGANSGSLVRNTAVPGTMCGRMQVDATRSTANQHVQNCPLTGHRAYIAESTQMTRSGHGIVIPLSCPMNC